ncbi:WecB/TagA/CpsF family glycosyltransferase [Crossiella cryophila]|uniref:Exopolysaccharide biosynthesis WecB/TagA/CpsF family protein n=1 Tax=Crossiella cryophila TaxID=43355 RepID=A0A7W7C8J1_9PSEU|nr:WecB/TagA/CpsF family glycosyltransferase [Crossiella cryophila]MBB4676527.1 exopolysaccharide biosynthesis WecB/TagA/CpsF family protein [Crossiella cryophila]
MRSNVPTVTVLGIRVVCLPRKQVLSVVGELLDSPAPRLLAYANAHSLNVAVRNAAYRRVLDDAALVLNDGAGLAIAARLQGKSFPDNLNGTDLTPEILRVAAERDAPVYFLGGEPGIAETAARNLTTRIPGLRVAGTRHGYFTPAEQSEVIEGIKASGARILVVAMGNPRQELWLDRHLADTGARLGVAVGAFLDFAAGKVSRAPEWMRKAGIEWLYRLGLEPRRLFARYVLGNPLFLARVLAERVFTKR